LLYCWCCRLGSDSWGDEWGHCSTAPIQHQWSSRLHHSRWGPVCITWLLCPSIQSLQWQQPRAGCYHIRVG
jgi:hypothetical protein